MCYHSTNTNCQDEELKGLENIETNILVVHLCWSDLELERVESLDDSSTCTTVLSYSLLEQLEESLRNGIDQGSLSRSWRED